MYYTRKSLTIGTLMCMAITIILSYFTTTAVGFMAGLFFILYTLVALDEKKLEKKAKTG